jgi:hypothetical protein
MGSDRPERLKAKGLRPALHAALTRPARSEKGLLWLLRWNVWSTIRVRNPFILAAKSGLNTPRKHATKEVKTQAKNRFKGQNF